MHWTIGKLGALAAFGCGAILTATGATVASAGEPVVVRTAQHRGAVPVRTAVLGESDRQQVKYESVQRRGRGWYRRGAPQGWYRGPSRAWTTYRRPGVYIGGPRVGVYYRSPSYGYYPPRFGYGVRPYRSYYYRW